MFLFLKGDFKTGSDEACLMLEGRLFQSLGTDLEIWFPNLTSEG